MRFSHLVVALVLFFSCTPSSAERLKEGDWIGSAGIGFMSSPALFLVSPHLERVHSPGLFLGVLMQAGMGGTNALFTLSFTARYQIGNDPRLRPTIEAGAGITSATAAFSSSFGLALHVGMGAEYLLSNNLALSSVVRANFAPPVQGFFLSWPVIQGRYLF